MDAARGSPADPVNVADPLRLAARLWPGVRLYSRQREILQSVWENDETFVHAGHELGKDFVGALAVLLFFLSRHPCRVVTTSADYSQLESVLWGEIRRFIQTAAVPLEREKGGPLVVNHLHLRKVVDGRVDATSYVLGRVAAKGEGLQGHHVADTGDGVPRTLFAVDEASGVDDLSYNAADTWARRKLVVGNPYPCQNFFRRGVKEGTRHSEDGRRCWRRVLKIAGEDSPNVALGLMEKRHGGRPSGKVILPGVLSWDQYEKRLATWDSVRLCVGIHGEFWEGAELLLLPPSWLNAAEDRARALEGVPREARAVGCDPGEGGADTAWSVVDHLGLIEQTSMPTPDTSVIVGQTLALMHRHGVRAEDVAFDRGGGGKQIADQLRSQGYDVRTVAFGEAASPEPHRGPAGFTERRDAREQRTAYVNRRAEMYGTLRDLLDPSREGPGFAIPARYTELRRELAPIPLLYDQEGRLRLPPKNRQGAGTGGGPTLVELVGHSPDRADSLALACWSMLNKAKRPKAGVF
jgi:hypothetical protein